MGSHFRCSKLWMQLYGRLTPIGQLTPQNVESTIHLETCFYLFHRFCPLGLNCRYYRIICPIINNPTNQMEPWIQFLILFLKRESICYSTFWSSTLLIILLGWTKTLTFGPKIVVIFAYLSPILVMELVASLPNVFEYQLCVPFFVCGYSSLSSS